MKITANWNVKLVHKTLEKDLRNELKDFVEEIIYDLKDTEDTDDTLTKFITNTKISAENIVENIIDSNVEEIDKEALVEILTDEGYLVIKPENLIDKIKLEYVNILLEKYTLDQLQILT